MIPPERVLLFVDEIRLRLRPVPLSPEEHFETIRDAADRGFAGGRIYDALFLRCARKCQAQTIYTWNLKHFRALAPDLAERIRTP